MPQLTYRLASPNCYRISADGVEIGSVSSRLQHVQNRYYWHWGVDTMPLMSHGGRPPSGEAETFEAALAAFKDAFTKWHAGIDPELWTKNVEYIAHCANRWRNRGT